MVFDALCLLSEVLERIARASTFVHSFGPDGYLLKYSLYMHCVALSCSALWSFLFFHILSKWIRHQVIMFMNCTELIVKCGQVYDYDYTKFLMIHVLTFD